MAMGVRMSVKEEFVEIKAVVHGRVQGVGFRATAQRHGKLLGLVGTVRNLSDGSVEICAKGSQVLIDRLFFILKQEEFPGCIKTIDVEKTCLNPQIKGFLIL